METIILTALATLVSAFVGSYLAGYLKQKGQNLATHEDIDKLVDQVTAVTTTTKRIEAEISSDVWDRQKQWELKRDTLLQAARRMADTEKAILRLEGVLKVETENAKNGTSSDLSQQQNDAIADWRSAMFAADETALLVNLVCGRDAGQLFTNLNSISGETVKRILLKDTSAYVKACREIEMRAGLIREFIRRELGTK
jgi:hypothetical protein